MTLQLQGDKHFWHGLQRLIHSRQNSSGCGKTYLYRFAVESPTQNHFKINRFGADVPGVCHGDEISYLFKNKYGDVPNRNTIEFKSIERFVCEKCFYFQQANIAYCSFFFFHKFRFLFSLLLLSREIPIQIS